MDDDGSCPPKPSGNTRRSRDLWLVRVIVVLFALHTVFIANTFTAAEGNWPSVDTPTAVKTEVVTEIDQGDQAQASNDAEALPAQQD